MKTSVEEIDVAFLGSLLQELVASLEAGNEEFGFNDDDAAGTTTCWHHACRWYPVSFHCCVSAFALGEDDGEWEEVEVDANGR